MPKPVQVAARIDPRVKRAVDALCRARGVKVGRFIEDALVDRLEEIADSQEVARLKREPTRPFAEVLRDLGLSDDV